MTRTRDILIFGGTPFHDPKSSVQKQMAASLAELGCRVLYTEAVPSPPGAPGELEVGQGILQITPLTRNPLLPMTVPGWNRRLNMLRNRARLRKEVARRGLREFVVLHYGWFSQEIAGSLGQALDVLDCIDADEERPVVARYPGFRRYVVRTENKLLDLVDGLILTSPALRERRVNRVRKYIVLPNGVNPSEFPAGVPEPERLRGIPRPRAALAGVLGPKIDIGLVVRLLEERRDLQVIVMGPVQQGGGTIRHSRLHALGEIPYGDLGSFLSWCDVGLIPLTETPYNRGSCPLKLLEYLASGIPVASVANPAVEAFAAEHPGLVFLSVDHDLFPEAVDSALAVAREDSTAARARGVVGRHTWRRRAVDTLDFIESLS